MSKHMTKRMTIGVALIVVGCGVLLGFRMTQAVTAAATPADELVVNQNQSGDTVKLGDHKTLRVEVPGNASTGYSWALVKIDGNAMEQVGGIESVAHKPIMPGSGSTIIFRFRTAKAGKATIHLAYSRPWEKDKPPAETFTITVIVDKFPNTAPATNP